MSFCLNPYCPKPQYAGNEKFCLICGSKILLQERYRVLRRLGGGGFGDTYEVSDIRDNSTKVMKVLKLNQQKPIELFQQEAQVLAYLKHPGIPKVEEDGYFTYLPKNSLDPIHCLVMEKIIGIDLEKWMSNRGMSPIDQELAIKWLKELVEILDKVHRQNFFHRDIKPANIMLKADGNLALIDFGTVREVTETYEVKLVAGQGVTGVISIGYTPQEQINGNAEPRSDFFALGRTFVYLLTGKHPLAPEIYDTQTDELRWNNHARHVSPLLIDFISTMMAPVPNGRPENTQIVLERLGEIEQTLDSKGRYIPKFRQFKPGMQFPQTQRKFLCWWVLACITGGLINFYLVDALGGVICIDISREMLGRFIIYPLFSVFLGITQWLVLRTWFYRTSWWVLATIYDSVILFNTIFLLHKNFILDKGCFSVYIAGSLGILQWLVLRRFVKRAVWWIIAIPLFSIISITIGSFPGRILVLLKIYERQVLNLFIIVIYFLYGLLTGVLLIWLSRSSKRL